MTSESAGEAAAVGRGATMLDAQLSSGCLVVKLPCRLLATDGRLTTGGRDEPATGRDAPPDSQTDVVG